MIVDFSKLKKDIKEDVDYFDHALLQKSGHQMAGSRLQPDGKP